MELTKQHFYFWQEYVTDGKTKSHATPQATSQVNK